MKTKVAVLVVSFISAMLMISCDKKEEVDCGALEKSFDSEVAALESVYEDYPTIDDSDGLDDQECAAFSAWISGFLTKTGGVVNALEQGKSCSFTKDYLVELGYETDEFDVLIADLEEALQIFEEELQTLCK